MSKSFKHEALFEDDYEFMTDNRPYKKSKGKKDDKKIESQKRRKQAQQAQAERDRAMAEISGSDFDE